MTPQADRLPYPVCAPARFLVLAAAPCLVVPGPATVASAATVSGPPRASAPPAASASTVARATAVARARPRADVPASRSRPRRGLRSGPSPHVRAAARVGKQQCTQLPTLYADWKEATLGTAASGEEIRAHVEGERESVAQLPDPFGPLLKMDEEELARKGERILWRDAQVAVFVDRFSPSPKLLVVPTKFVMFLTDASEQVVERLARVAAASSDALLRASDRACDTDDPSRIYVNPPRRLGVKRLHVHVQPTEPIRHDGDANAFYARVAGQLKELLSQDDGDGAGRRPIAEQASGLVRKDAAVLIVDDESAGGYFRYPVPDELPARLEPSAFEWIRISAGTLAVDIEGVEVLCDGRKVLLSERLRKLITDAGWVAEYDDPLGEVGERGLEGVAVRHCEGDESRSHVAVVWEGGYMQTKNLLPALVSRNDTVMLGNRSVPPVVFTHLLQKDALTVETKDDPSGRYVQLQVANPPGDEPAAQRFRVPDLVWHRIGDRDEWGFVVLLNSSSAVPEDYEHLWLQRFDREGRPVGGHIDLNQVLPPEVRDLNWEGLAWNDEGKSLLLIDDTSKERSDGPPYIARVPLPEEWRE